MKKVLVFITVAFLALSLAACKKVKAIVIDWNVISDDLEVDTSQPVEIIFWHSMGKTNMEYLDGYIREFNKIYPHITVKHESKGGYDNLRDAINQALPAGIEPHLSFSYTDHVAGYINSGRALPLNNLINNKNPEIALSEADIADFVEGYWNEGSVYDAAGTILNLPFIKSTEVMFYNKTFFETHNLEVPQTWDEAKAVAQQIRTIVDNDSNLTAEQKAAKIPIGYDSEANMFITVLEQKGIPYTRLNDDGTAEVLFNNQDAKDTIAYFKDMYDKKLLVTKEMMGGAYTSDKFKVEDLYMSISSTGGTSYNVPQKDFEAGVAPIPQFDLNNQKVIQQGPNLNMFLKDNVQEMVAAWLFVKFLTSTEISADYSVKTGYSPVRKSSYETETYLNYINAVNPSKTQQLYIDVLTVGGQQVDNYYTSPAFDRSSKTRDEVGAIIVKVFGGTASIDEAFNKAMEEINF